MRITRKKSLDDASSGDSRIDEIRTVEADADADADVKSNVMSVSECCTILSNALENGIPLIKNNVEEEEDDDDDDDDDEGTNTIRIEKATSAFVSIMSSSTNERLLHLDAIRSVKFQKRHARRLFSAVLPILKHIFDHEHYVPLSAFESVEDESNNSSNNAIYRSSTADKSDNYVGGEENTSSSTIPHNNNPTNKLSGTIGNTSTSISTNVGTSRNKRNSDISNFSDCTIVPDDASTEALLFIKYSALIVHAFLNNQMNRNNRRKSSTCKSTNNTNISTSTSTSKRSNTDRVFDMVEEAYVIAELLHNNLFALNSCGKEGITVQREIVAMCESYWKGQFTDREVLVTQLMPLLVVKSLNGNATMADIKRLWNMRQALQLLDFQEHSTIIELRNLLLKTVSSPLYIKHVEGRKMVAFLFQLDVSLVKSLHHSIRAQIPFAKNATLESYGEIYLSAWKVAAKKAKNVLDMSSTSDDDNNSDLEDSSILTIQTAVEDALQDLMFASLHAPTPHMAKAILIVLEPIHSQKKNPDIDSLLYRMYNPILWRALSAANPLVRIHASTILRCTFPLHDPNAGKAHLKEVNSKSIEVLIRLLNDDDPKVRVAGCDAAVRHLGVFWDALQTNHIRSLLNEIVMKHINDASSAAVRAQAVKGITLLLDAQASHGVLRPLLPLIGDHIHDSVERVRLACVRLLLKVKCIKGIKYYHVVPSQHILARLAAEGEGLRKTTGSVASAITELLVNSYFPKGAKGSEQMRRTLHFIVQNPAASRVFYANISKHLETNNTSKLIVMLIKTFKVGVEKEKSKVDVSNKKRACKDKEEEDSDDDDNARDNNGIDRMEVTASNTPLMAGVAETISIVWKSIWNDLCKEENKECLEFIQSSISGLELAELCAFFEDYTTNNAQTDCDGTETDDCDRICTSLLCCATFITTRNVSEFSAHLANRMKTRQHINVIPYFAALCSWGMENQVALSLSKSITTIFDDISGNTGQKLRFSLSQSEDSHFTRSKRKQSSLLKSYEEDIENVMPQMPGKAALELIGTVLSGKDSGSTAVREKILSSEIASCAIGTTLEQATTIADRILTGTVKCCYDGDITLILNACEIYSRFTLHKEAVNNYPIKIRSHSRENLLWMSNRVTKALVQMKDKQDLVASPLFQDLNLSRISAIGCRTSDIQPPLSPLPVSPPRRRSNLNSSSNIDTSFISMEKRGACEFIVNADISTSVRAHVMGISLIRSAMSVFGEWLLVGVEDGSEIVKHVKKWCQVMKQMNESSKENHFIEAKTQLFPSLCRMAIISAKSTSEYDLLIEALSVYDTLNSSDGALEVLNKSIQNILSLRGANSIKHITKFVQAIVDAIPLLLKNNKSGEIPLGLENNEVAIEDLVQLKNCGWVVALRMILRNGKGTPALIEILLNNLDSAPSDEFITKIYLKILHLSCKKCPQGKIGGQIKDILANYVQSKGSVENDNLDNVKIFLEAIPA